MARLRKPGKQKKSGIPKKEFPIILSSSFSPCKKVLKKGPDGKIPNMALLVIFWFEVITPFQSQRAYGGNPAEPHPDAGPQVTQLIRLSHIIGVARVEENQTF